MRKSVVETIRNNTVFLIKNIAIPVAFLITLVFSLPFEQKIKRIYLMIEWTTYRPNALPNIVSSLIVIYVGLILVCTYILLDRTPIVVAPILALLTGIFATDYWELPKFVLHYLASYQEQIAGGSRPALSFLWSPSLFHMFSGLIVLALLDFKWNKKKVFLFLLTPWVMYAINGLHPVNINQINLGPLGTIVPGVARGLPNRIISNLVLVYIISGVRWRGIRPLLNFIKGTLNRARAVGKVERIYERIIKGGFYILCAHTSCRHQYRLRICGKW